MIELRKQHYFKMLKNGRLIPFIPNGSLIAFLTFYITDNAMPYVNADPWDVLEDNPNGRICYINQLMTTNDKGNARLSYGIWCNFKKYIKDNFKNVECIYWRRWNEKEKIVKEYLKVLSKE